ncbi:type II toxin-antitoxin system YafQ family toxin [Congzhengia minquanensis]|uniref:Type II toxin-antitoxin system YafQ family toxin n=1 Tax=Congzhengia minquanensis TaxID=2763657 RepID=A0A926DN97_9FIRM|nr:type II toxin-antitoxin system YafQ family toxin [Congzhengia minquanensis]MBC8540822.1 type II toxin-antitoxin system YafQ family toxin [Congzhengia minquanensis]
MLNLNWSSKYKKDFKNCIKRNYDLSLIETVINTLRIPEPLPAKYYNHLLQGDYKGCQECHIAPDWLLIYQVFDNELYLIRTGTHSDLFE